MRIQAATARDRRRVKESGEGNEGNDSRRRARRRGTAGELDAVALGSEADVARGAGESWENAREEVGVGVRAP